MKFRVAVITSKYNEMITSKLHEAALTTLRKSEEVDAASIREYWVPGAFELPVACAAAVKSGAFDAVIALGCVIRGETAHFDYICQQAAAGLMSVSVNSGVPVVFGVLTTENLDQAMQRSGANFDNKGAEAARTAIETLRTVLQLRALK